MIGLVATERREFRRWAMSAAVVVVLPMPAEPPRSSPGANKSIRLNQPPRHRGGICTIAGCKPPNRESDIPPGPEQVMSDASPERPVDSDQRTGEAKTGAETSRLKNVLQR